MDCNLSDKTQENKMGEFENDRPPSPVISMNKSCRKSLYGKLHHHRRTRGKLASNLSERVDVDVDEGTVQGVFVFGKETITSNEVKVKNDMGHRLQKIIDIESRRTQYLNIMTKENESIEKCAVLEDYNFKKPAEPISQKNQTKNVSLSPRSYEAKSVISNTLPQLTIDLSPTAGFKTGSGKKISISKSAVKEHSKLFEDILNSTQTVVKKMTKTSTTLYRNKCEETTHKKMHKLFENKQFNDVSGTSQSSLNCSLCNPELSIECKSFFTDVNNANKKHNIIKDNDETNTTVEQEYNKLEEILKLNSEILKEKNIHLNKSHNLNNTNNNKSVVKTLNEVNERCENILGVLATATSDLQEAASTCSDMCKGISKNDLNFSQNKTEKLINTVGALQNSVNSLEGERYGFTNSEIESTQNYVRRFEKNLEEYEQKLYALFENHIIKKIQKCKSIFSVKSVDELERQKFLLEKTKEIVEQCRIKLQSEIETLEDHVIPSQCKSVNCKKILKTMANNNKNKRSNDESTNSPRKRLRSYKSSNTFLPNLPMKCSPLKKEKFDKPPLTTEWYSDGPIEQKNSCDSLLEHIQCDSGKISIESSRQMEIALDGPNSVHIGINMKKQNSENCIQIDLDFKQDENKLSVSKSPPKQQNRTINLTVENENSVICDATTSSAVNEQNDKTMDDIFALGLNGVEEIKKDIDNNTCHKNIDFKTASKNEVSEKTLKNALTVFNKDKSFSDNYLLGDNSKNNLKAALSMDGFKTASLKNINVPKESIQKALTVFKKDEDFANNCISSNMQKDFEPNTGFATASGKNICISKKAIQKALSTFQEDDNFSATDNVSENINVGMTSDKNITASKAAAAKALSIFDDQKFSEEFFEKDDYALKYPKNIGFSTAMGKNIAVSKQALEKASCLFKASEDFAENRSSSNEDHEVPEKNVPNTGFSTASGRNIKVSKESLKKALVALDENNYFSGDFTLKNGIYADAEEYDSTSSNFSTLEEKSESKQTLNSQFDNEEFSFKNVKHTDDLNNFENKSFQNVRDDSTQQNRSNPTCKKRLGMSFCKPVEFSASKLEKAKSIFEGCFDNTASTCPIVIRSESSNSNISKTNTPQRYALPNIYSSTPVRDTKNLPVASTSISYNFNKDMFDNPNITPIKNEKSLNINEKIHDVVIKNITEGRLIEWQENVHKEHEDVKKRLKLLTERKKMLDLQVKMFQNPTIEYTRRRLGVLSVKKQQKCRIPLKKFVDNAKPRNESNHFVTPQNAILVHFDCSKCDETKNMAYIKTLDEAIVVPNIQNYVGLAEIMVALKTMPGVEIRLIPKGWIENHYKWIVWKLARLENMFPIKFKGCLSIENVMLQLKYRYDREIDRVERSALRLIFEGDDAPQRRMVLCVSNIIKEENNYELELTDGWYSMRTLIDRPLCKQIQKSRIKIDTKIITHGAELVNCEPCYPLEAPSHARLKINYNSTRPASWDSKLGFQKISGPLVIKIKTINCDGGKIGGVKIYIARKYPLQYIEQYEGKKVMRNEKAEQLRAQEWDNVTSQKRKELQKKLYQNECEEFNLLVRNKPKTYSIYKESDILKIECPQTLYEIIQNSNDPDSIREVLTSSQLSSVVQYESNLLAKRNFDISSKLDTQINEMQLHKRNVSCVLQLRVLDGSEYSERDAILKVWNPTDELEKILKEESTFSVYNLTPNVRGELQANTKTVFIPESSTLTQYKIMSRRVLKIEMTLQKFCKTYFKEFDTVGVVIKTFVDSHEQYLWISDASERLLLIRIFEGPHKIALLENLKKGNCVVAVNLILREPHKCYGQAIANYCTIISSYPKHTFLQEELKNFSEQIDVSTSLLNNCEQKVSEYELSWKNSCVKSSVSNISDLVDSSDESTIMQSKLDATDIAMSLLDTDQLIT